LVKKIFGYLNMKIVLQRVSTATVKVDNKLVGKVSKGLLLYIGISNDDSVVDITKLIDKIINLRIFNDNNSKMNYSIKDINGELLIVSQFTLYADCSHGNRPSFIKAASKNHAENIYNQFVNYALKQNIKVETGVFGANMKVNSVNDGPVTILLSSNEK